MFKTNLIFGALNHRLAMESMTSVSTIDCRSHTLGISEVKTKYESTRILKQTSVSSLPLYLFRNKHVLHHFFKEVSP